MPYTREDGMEVYTPEELGISWGDVWGGIKTAGGKAAQFVKEGAERELQKRYAPQPGAAPVVPQRPPQTFLQKYGLLLALGAGGLVLFFVLKKKKG